MSLVLSVPLHLEGLLCPQRCPKPCQTSFLLFSSLSQITWSHSTDLSYSSSYWSNSCLQWQRHEVEALQSSCYSTVWSDPLCREAAAGMDSLLQGLILCKSGKQLWALSLQQTCKQEYNQSHSQYKSKQRQEGSLGDHSSTWVSWEPSSSRLAAVKHPRIRRVLPKEEC